MRRHFITTVALTLAVGLAGMSANAALIGQLGILDTSGINPATGQQWAAGDTYHLLFVTSDSLSATSTNIADYNAFVQSQANAAGMGSVNWFALGSTSSVNAIDNAIITGPVINVYDNAAVAMDAAEFWDFQWPDGNPISDLLGNNRNVWTGTERGGLSTGTTPLGASSVRRYWTGWVAWGNPGGASANETNTLADRFMVAISEELTVMAVPEAPAVPEPTSIALLGLGGLAMLSRRRRN